MIGLVAARIPAMLIVRSSKVTTTMPNAKQLALLLQIM